MKILNPIKLLLAFLLVKKMMKPFMIISLGVRGSVI